jgi:peptide-methionine (S)-S-oxide reductase
MSHSPPPNRTPLWVAVFALLVTGCLLLPRVTARPTPASTVGKREPGMKTETAVFGGGCFWGVETAFREIEGVVDTSVGYMGGHVDNPTYFDVCAGRTGHAEVVRVEFDPSKVSYERLLEVFWSVHDPTTLNRQGPDVGPQYRSVIFPTTAAQREAAVASKAAQQAICDRSRRTVFTEIVPASTFWRAEEYHQQFEEKNGRQCHF